MARIINQPALQSRSGTPGERRFACRLEALLEEDYLCWYDVPVGPKRVRPDFIILHPDRGLLLLEVKDWKINTIRSLDKCSAQILADGVLKTVVNPLEQARSNMFAVKERLEADPQLRHSAGRHQGKLCFPYGYGVVLTNITRRQLNERLTEDEQELVLPARLVICKDEMTESVDAMQFQEQLWGMHHYAFGMRLTLPQIERIRWHLFPEIRIRAVQQDLFSKPKPAAAEEATVPEIVRVMDLHQEQLARSLGGGHRVIHGVAGSGKTLLLGFRCLHLAETMHKPILVLCFNRTLAARLRAFISEGELSQKVHVYHFHGWCAEQLRSYHVDLLPFDAPIYDRQVLSVIEGVRSGRIPRAQYGAVMIDEGHDFEPEWFQLVVQMVDPVSDSLLLLYDDAQSIYRKSSGLDFSLSSVGIKAPGRTTILRLNYRNTREILDFAYTFAKCFIAPQAADDDHIPLIEPQSAGSSGPRPIFRRRASLKDEVEFAANCLKKWHAAGEPLHEMAVICTSRAQGELMQRQLERVGLPHLWMRSSDAKSSYDPGKSQVSILSVQSSKGLEFKSVIFIGLGHLRDNSADAAAEAKLIYVGMTRARERLVLTASAENACTESLAALAA